MVQTRTQDTTRRIELLVKTPTSRFSDRQRLDSSQETGEPASIKKAEQSVLQLRKNPNQKNHYQ